MPNEKKTEKNGEGLNEHENHPRSRESGRMQFVNSRTVANHWARFEKQAAKNYKKTTGVRTDAFHQKVLFDFSEDACLKVADFLLMVEVIGKWPTTASVIMFFLLPQTVHSTRRIASRGGNGTE